MKARPVREGHTQPGTPVPHTHEYTPEPEVGDSISQHDGWTISFIDLLMLLLTMFVLLLSFKDGVIKEKTHVASAKTIHQTITVTHKDKPKNLLPNHLTPVIPTIKTLKPQETQAGMINDVVKKLRQDYAKQDNERNDVRISTGTNSIKLEISEAILFAPASDELTPKGEDVLKKLAGTLVDYPYRLSVEGHTDNVPISSGQFPSNWELSTSRATKVTRRLIDDGFPAAAIRSIGYGDTQPIADNDTPEGRARNRRVSIVIDLPGDKVMHDARN